MTALTREFEVRNLTKQEIKLARLATEGKTNQEIADSENIKLKTVKSHYTNVYKKLKVTTKVKLVVYCIPYLIAEEREKREYYNSLAFNKNLSVGGL